MGRGGCPFLTKHFNYEENCFDKGFSVSILEKLFGSGLNAGLVDPLKVSPRKDKESKWMKAIRSVYPYGMNHDTGNGIYNESDITGLIFTKLSTKHNRTKSNGRRNHTTNNFELNNYLEFIKNTMDNDIKNSPNTFRKSICSLTKANLK